MADKTVGALIREARTGAGLTQEQLAKQINGLSAPDISKAERDEAQLTQAVLKQIAKATGVTQASLLNAARAGSAAKTKASSGAKKESAKKESAGKDDAKKESGKKNDALKLSAAEKKLVRLYREADRETRELAVTILNGKNAGVVDSLLSGAAALLGKK